jgi:hypothetical protein
MPFVCMPRSEGTSAEGPSVLGVDSADCAPPAMVRFRCFNPFHVFPLPVIPVPGRPLRSRSVEAVWQGLKLVDGLIDLAMLGATPYKRPSEREREAPGYRYAESCFAHGDRVIDLVLARYLVYLPAYLYLLEALVPGDVIEELVAHHRRGGRVIFYDWDDNFDIEDASRPYSHSAVLRAWFGGTLEHELLQPGRDHVHRRAAEIPLPGCLLEPSPRYRALHR